jgi:hypothetical protein
MTGEAEAVATASGTLFAADSLIGVENSYESTLVWPGPRFWISQIACLPSNCAGLGKKEICAPMGTWERLSPTFMMLLSCGPMFLTASVTVVDAPWPPNALCAAPLSAQASVTPWMATWHELVLPTLMVRVISSHPLLVYVFT